MKPIRLFLSALSTKREVAQLPESNKGLKLITFKKGLPSTGFEPVT